MNPRLAFAVPLALLLLQLSLFVVAPTGVSTATAYIAMVVAPLLAAACTLRRGWREIGPARSGWWAISASLLIWSLGAFGNLWHEWVLGNTMEMYRAPMLAFALAEVPITFLVATEWRLGPGRRLVRTMDGAIALALGYAYFAYTWSRLTERGMPDDAGVLAMVWLLDTQNAILALAALVRWRAADSIEERTLFRALFVHTAVYVLLLFLNNHYIAGRPDTGPRESSLITIDFALLSSLALLRAKLPHIRIARPDATVVRVVQGASPLLLASALLVISLFLIRVDYVLGAAGVMIAVLGYGLRGALARVTHIQREDQLEQTTTILETIAATDALTGIANRRALEQALATSTRRPGAPMSVLMIDIDQFKLFNDRYGHPAGDSCLRSVARTLQECLGRSGDTLARYGGEEFIVVLTESSEAGALMLAEQMRAAIAHLRIEHAASVDGVVTASFGVWSGHVQSLGDADALIQLADQALYRAKQRGRNRVEGTDASRDTTIDTVRAAANGRLVDDSAVRGPRSRPSLRLVDPAVRDEPKD